MEKETRFEHDSLGEMEVPADAYYGIHALRSSRNFDLSGQPVHRELIYGIAQVKSACAQANRLTGYLSDEIADAIIAASKKVANGDFDSQFITDALQGGAGTSTNMNVNEVVANVALEEIGNPKGAYDVIHPLDHVNLAQSTNDAVPTGAKIGAIKLIQLAIDAMAKLVTALKIKETEFADVLKVGRTEMQDAVPITLGQEFGAWAKAIRRDWWRLCKAEERLREVNLGGTAIGTGINADENYVHIVVDFLRDVTGLNLVAAEDLVDATQNCDIFVEVSGLLRTTAVNLHKIASDLRLMSSGPKTGFAEVHLPPLQAGSSIMPGKVNPTATEALSQAAFQIMANDQAIALSAMSGQLELNAFVPLIVHSLYSSLSILCKAAEMFAEKCVKGIKADVQRCADFIENSFVLVTALSPHIGYEKAAHFAKEARENGRTIRQVAQDSGEFTEQDLERILDPVEMTRPGIAGLLAEEDQLEMDIEN